jgi:hypothetical protein
MVDQYSYLSGVYHTYASIDGFVAVEVVAGHTSMDRCTLAI